MDSVYTVMLLDPGIRILFFVNIAWIARKYPFVYFYSKSIYWVIIRGHLTHKSNVVDILQTTMRFHERIFMKEKIHISLKRS